MSREEHKGAIEVSVIFHEGQRMFAVPKQPAPVEPVAWCSQCGHKCPQPAPVQQEPVAWWDANLGVFDEKHFDQLQPLYTSPPAQRTWVGLTDKETEHLWEISRAAIPRYHTFKILIEKTLRERNT